MAVAITRDDLSASDLRLASVRCADSAMARRALALALVLEGKNRTEAARSAGMDRQTLRDWVHRFNAGGPEGLTETLPVYAYVEGFGNQHFGTGAAISMLTLVILVALMSYYFRVILKQEDEL